MLDHVGMGQLMSVLLVFKDTEDFQLLRLETADSTFSILKEIIGVLKVFLVEPFERLLWQKTLMLYGLGLNLN